MQLYSKAARRWIEPLLVLGVGEAVALRFLPANSDPSSDLGLVSPGADSFADYPAPSWYVRELTAEELAVLAGQLRQGAREVLLSNAFARSVAAAQGFESARQMFEAAAGLLIRGQICRISAIKPMDAGGETYGWQLLCDAALEAV